MNNEPKKSAAWKFISELKLPIGQQPEKVRELLGLYFQEREIFPMTNGRDETSWDEASAMTTFQQIELLERIVGDSHFHQNLPVDTIPGIEEGLKKIDKEAFRITQDVQANKLKEVSTMAEKKKHPPVHEGMIECLKSAFCAKSDVAFITHIYGRLDSKCPAKAIPDLIAALEPKLTAYPELEQEINLAITNLKAQLEEEKAEKETAIPACTNCNGKLEKIEKPDGLSEEEWDQQKRGDLFCPGCHRFFFLTDGELKPGHDD